MFVNYRIQYERVGYGQQCGVVFYLVKFGFQALQDRTAYRVCDHHNQLPENAKNLSFASKRGSVTSHLKRDSVTSHLKRGSDTSHLKRGSDTSHLKGSLNEYFKLSTFENGVDVTAILVKKVRILVTKVRILVKKV